MDNNGILHEVYTIPPTKSLTLKTSYLERKVPPVCHTYSAASMSDVGYMSSYLFYKGNQSQVLEEGDIPPPVFEG